ncbi:hypothetical protein VXS03_00025 [Photobacterium sp. S4TG1]|uniref:hypothetical protein n=1 Tax=Photobacterium sp. S4TG1 TaxID=3114587 RepID=UPI002E18D969|nr:hypothetical protein [Photobacterium sp. S4TG1]
MKKFLLILVFILITIAPVLSYLSLFQVFSFLLPHIDIIKTIARYQVGGLFVIMLFVWVYGFSQYKILEYGMHIIAGFISIVFALIAMVGICFDMYSMLCFILLCLSCLLSIYCVSVPVLAVFQKKMRGPWEYIIVTIIFGSSLTFIINGYASVLVNETFGINAKYLPFSTILSMFIVLSPFFVIISFVVLFFIIVFNEKTDLFKNKDGDNKFYLINALVGVYVLFIVSLGVGTHISKNFERVASTFDFDSHYYCVFSEKVDGVIFLDSQYSKVLTYKEGRKPLYKVMTCNIK